MYCYPRIIHDAIHGTLKKKLSVEGCDLVAWHSTQANIKSECLGSATWSLADIYLQCCPFIIPNSCAPMPSTSNQITLAF